MRLVAPSEPNSVLKGGRRRNHEAGYCVECYGNRMRSRTERIATTLTPEQEVVLTMLDTKIADDAERRDLALALGLVGEPA